MVCAGNDGFSRATGAGIGECKGDDADLGVLGGDGGARGAGGAGGADGDVSVNFFIWCASMCLCNWLFEENLSGHRLHS